MARAVYILGGGGHARVLLDAMMANGRPADGVLDLRLALGDVVLGVPVVGTDEFLDHIDPADAFLVNGLGANPSTDKRRTLFKAMRAKGFEFMTVQHPAAVIGSECVLGQGVQVMAGAVVQNRVHMGANTVVNTRASVDHDCEIGESVFISPGVVLCGEVLIAGSAFIGAGAVVLPGVQVGAHAIVAAGSVVIRSVSDEWTVAGNPAVRIGTSE
jgi:sugar O-acyltransferase (sialic acid O-acetyltransferase NeuD family)